MKAFHCLVALISLFTSRFPLNLARIQKITPIFQRFLPTFSLQKASLSLRNSLPAAIIAVGVISTNPAISVAKIPSMSDYNTGSGTVIRPKNIIKTPQRIIDYSSTNVRDFISSTIPSYMIEVKEFSEQGSWNLINKSSKLMRKSILRENCFGKGTAQELAKALQVSEGTGADLDALREELFFAVGQVGDFAISNQVYVFNEDDMKQVQLLREASGEEGGLSSDDRDMQVDEEEVKRVAAEGKKLVSDLENISDRIAKYQL